MKKAYVILRLCLPATILLGGCMTTGLSGDTGQNGCATGPA